MSVTQYPQVAIVVPAISGGGAEAVARLWAESLDGAGRQITVLVTHDNAAVSDRVNLQTVDGTGTLARVLNIRRWVIDNQPFAVLSLMTFSNIIVLIAVMSIPPRLRPRVVISEHNLPTGLRDIYGWRQFVQSKLARALYRYADAWIAVSPAVAAACQEAFKLTTARMWVVPNPVAPVQRSNHHAPTQQRSPAGQAVAISGDTRPLQLVFAGRLVKQKSPDLLLEIARYLHTKQIACEVHFFGDGPLRADLEEKAGGLVPSTTFHGWVSDWPNLCTHRSVLVSTSAFEGFGNVLVEAAGNGIPSVACVRALGSSSALVDGVTGRLSRTLAPSSMSDAILEAAELRMVGFDEWLDLHSLRACRSNLIEMLESLSTFGESS